MIEKEELTPQEYVDLNKIMDILDPDYYNKRMEKIFNDRMMIMAKAIAEALYLNGKE